MIIKIFKISTKEMWTLKNKSVLCDFIKQETEIIPDNKLAIDKLIKLLPRENYCWVKRNT